MVLFNYLRHCFYRHVFLIFFGESAPNSFCVMNWISFSASFIGWRTCVAAQALIVCRQAYSWVRLRDQRGERWTARRGQGRGEEIYSTVLFPELWCQRLRDSFRNTTVPYWDTHAKFMRLSRHSWLKWGEERWQGTDTSDNRERLLENCRNRYTLPIKVHYGLLPDRCFLFVPVRPADSSLFSIVARRQRGHEDTLFVFPWIFCRWV